MKKQVRLAFCLKNGLELLTSNTVILKTLTSKEILFWKTCDFEKNDNLAFNFEKLNFEKYTIFGQEYVMYGQRYVLTGFEDKLFEVKFKITIFKVKMVLNQGFRTTKLPYLK